jgi:hypothetical protein
MTRAEAFVEMAAKVEANAALVSFLCDRELLLAMPCGGAWPPNCRRARWTARPSLASRLNVRFPAERQCRPLARRCPRLRLLRRYNAENAHH